MFEPTRGPASSSSTVKPAVAQVARDDVRDRTFLARRALDRRQLAEQIEDLRRHGGRA